MTEQEQMDSLMANEMLRDYPLEFQDDSSTLVASATYDPGQQQMWVTLKAGAVERDFLYGGVPAQMWKEFYDARSRGGYFNRYIKPMFEGKAKP